MKNVAKGATCCSPFRNPHCDTLRSPDARTVAKQTALAVGKAARSSDRDAGAADEGVVVTKGSGSKGRATLASKRGKDQGRPRLPQSGVLNKPPSAFAAPGGTSLFSASRDATPDQLARTIKVMGESSVRILLSSSIV